MQPFSGHGHQCSPATDSKIPTELDGAGQKRSWPGTFDQTEHVRNVVESEFDQVRIGGHLESGADHLHPLSVADELPSGGRGVDPSGEGHHTAWADQRSEVIPYLFVVVGRHGDEGGYVHRVAGGLTVHLGEMPVGAGQRRPGGVVERIGVGGANEWVVVGGASGVIGHLGPPICRALDRAGQ